MKSEINLVCELHTVKGYAWLLVSGILDYVMLHILFMVAVVE